MLCLPTVVCGRSISWSVKLSVWPAARRSAESTNWARHASCNSCTSPPFTIWHSRTHAVTGSARHKNKIHTRRHRRAREIPNHNQLYTDTQHTRATHAHMASVRIRRAVHIRRDYYNHNDTTIRMNERKRKSERISSGRYSHLSGRSVIFYSSPRLVDYRRVPIRSTNCVFCVFLKVIHNSKWRTTPTTISTEHRSEP